MSLSLYPAQIKHGRMMCSLELTTSANVLTHRLAETRLHTESFKAPTQCFFKPHFTQTIVLETGHRKEVYKKPRTSAEGSCRSKQAFPQKLVPTHFSEWRQRPCCQKKIVFPSHQLKCVRGTNKATVVQVQEGLFCLGLLAFFLKSTLLNSAPI